MKQLYSFKLSFALLVFTLGLYIATLSPTISIGDSPELTASAFTLGIAHPPGYPLFGLSGKVLSFVPVSNSVAYRINLLSAICGSISVLLVYLACMESVGLLVHRQENSHKAQANSLPVYRFAHLAAFAGSLTFAFSPIFWSQSLISEVYTLNSVFFAGLLYLSLKWAGIAGWTNAGMGIQPYLLRSLCLISFLWGIGLGNHHTLIAFGPIFMVFAVIHSQLKAERLRLTDSLITISRTSSLVITFFLLGLSVYLYLPARSAQNPFMDWGNTEKLSGFLDVIFRKQFSFGSREYSLIRSWLQTEYYFSLLREQFTLPGLIMGITGVSFFFKRNSMPSLFTMALFLVHGIITIIILNPAPDEFYSMDVMLIPSFAVFSIWITMGMIVIFSGVSTVFMRNLAEDGERNLHYVLFLICLLQPAALVYANLDRVSQRDNTFAYDYATDVLNIAEPNSVIFVEADISLFPLWYMQYVEGKRHDVAVLDVDMLMLPWFKGQLKEKYPAVEVKVPDVIKHAKGGKFKPLSLEALETYKVFQVEGMLDSLLEKHPVYMSYDFGVPFKEFGERKDLYIIQKGITFRVSKEMLPEDIAGSSLALRSILKAVDSRDEEVLFIARGYIPAMERISAKELSSGRENDAVRLLEGILIVDPYNTESLNTLAYLYAKQGKNFIKAEMMIRKALSLNPWEKTRYLKTLGYVYLKKGNFSKAREIFEEVLKLEPASEWTHLRLEEALKSAGN